MTINIIDHAPRVFIVGATTPKPTGIADFLEYREKTWVAANGADMLVVLGSNGQPVIELGGRVCYDSFHNPAKKTTDQYIRTSIIEQEHGSVLEHFSLNALVCSVPRSVQLEMVRHRAGTGYSWQSQRFTDKQLEFIVPPLIREDKEARELFEDSCRDTLLTYEDLARKISAEPLGEDVESTLKRKRLKEAARSVLSNAVGSDGLITINGRALRHVIELRTDEHADASIREFAYELYQAALPYAWAILADAEEKEVAFGVPQIMFKHSKI